MDAGSSPTYEIRCQVRTERLDAQAQAGLEAPPRRRGQRLAHERRHAPGTNGRTRTTRVREPAASASARATRRSGTRCGPDLDARHHAAGRDDLSRRSAVNTDTASRRLTRSSAAVSTRSTPSATATRSTRISLGPRSLDALAPQAAARRRAASSSWTSPGSGTSSVTVPRVRPGPPRGPRQHRPTAERPQVGRDRRRPLDQASSPTRRSRVSTAPDELGAIGGRCGRDSRSARDAYPAARRRRGRRDDRPERFGAVDTAPCRARSARSSIAIRLRASLGSGGSRSPGPGQGGLQRAPREDHGHGRPILRVRVDVAVDLLAIGRVGRGVVDRLGASRPLPSSAASTAVAR